MNFLNKMINFFRNIRKKLANENKFQRYMRYAIGEVVLVVVGILIALSINNWNDQRKVSNKEKEMLVTLKSDLENNIEVLKTDIKNLEFNANVCDTLLDIIELKKTFTDYLPRYFHKARVTENNKLSSTSYESLKSTGFDIIENITLRNEIIKLYEGTYAKMIENLSSLINNSGELYFSYYLNNFYSTGDERAIPNNYEKVINDPIYKNILGALKTKHLWSIELKDICIDESERLIQLIDKELSKI